MSTINTTRKLTITALTAALLLGLSSGALAQECKEMEKAACEKSGDRCSWVDPYTRKDNVKVSGHCRKKAKKKSSS